MIVPVSVVISVSRIARLSSASLADTVNCWLSNVLSPLSYVMERYTLSPAFNASSARLSNVICPGFCPYSVEIVVFPSADPFRPVLHRDTMFKLVMSLPAGLTLKVA